jgi:cytochrome c556
VIGLPQRQDFLLPVTCLRKVAGRLSDKESGMKLTNKMLVLGLVFAGGMAVAQDAKDPTVVAWKALMMKNAGAAKTLGGMASGKVAFDQAAADAAKASLIEDSKATPAAFQTEAADPASRALPAIWTNWDDFVAKAGGLAAAAEALDTSSAETIAAGMEAIGGACGACHKLYQKPK